MGVKSTINLSRRVAEEKYVEFKLRTERRKFLGQAVAMENKQLENVLETMNDDQAGGEGFENYIIDGD
jgi:hypothetical protein